MIQVVEKAVEEAIFYPQESPLNCSGCPYHRPCRGWTGSTDFEHARDMLCCPEEVLAC
jgi:hypothetical protein